MRDTMTPAEHATAASRSRATRHARRRTDLAVFGPTRTFRNPTPAIEVVPPPRHARNAIRLLLTDDHAVFRAGLGALLQRQPDLAVIGQAGTGDEAVARAEELRPDVILMDLAMPGEGGIAATRRIVALGIGARVLVLTALRQEQQLLDALEAGASGYIEKAAPVDELTRAIRTVRRGELFLGEDTAILVVLQRYEREARADDARAAADQLSAFERHLLTLLALGHGAREISDLLAISPKAVGDARARLMQRLGLRGRVDLVRFALRSGLLTENDGVYATIVGSQGRGRAEPTWRPPRGRPRGPPRPPGGTSRGATAG
jgi:DNA-binding NarL/FixJ family response regulator